MTYSYFYAKSTKIPNWTGKSTAIVGVCVLGGAARLLSDGLMSTTVPRRKQEDHEGWLRVWPTTIRSLCGQKGHLLCWRLAWVQRVMAWNSWTMQSGHERMFTYCNTAVYSEFFDEEWVSFKAAVPHRSQQRSPLLRQNAAVDSCPEWQATTRDNTGSGSTPLLKYFADTFKKLYYRTWYVAFHYQ